MMIDTEQLENAADEVILLKDEMSHQMTEIELLIQSLPTAWQGDAARTLAGKILYVKQCYRLLENFFEDYAQMMKQFATNVYNCDQTTASKINQT